MNLMKPSINFTGPMTFYHKTDVFIIETFGHRILKIVYPSFTPFFLSNRSAAEWQIAVAIRFAPLCQSFKKIKYKTCLMIKCLMIKRPYDKMSYDKTYL